MLSQITRPLLQWYEKNARSLPWRENRDPYRIWISEIMLQQTRVEAVKPYYIRFLSRLPSVEALAAVSEEELFKLWEGLGYYSRARNLRRAAEIICQRYGGVFPSEYRLVLALPGIGPYTAGAICSICFEAPTPAVDGNVLRVLSRLWEWDGDIRDPGFQKEATLALAKIYPPGHCGAFTQSLMELGAVICTPNGAPHCDACPLRFLCKAAESGTQTAYPVRVQRRPRKQEKKTVFLLYTDDGKIALRQRPAKGLLAGLWEFPNEDGHLSTECVRQWLNCAGLSAGQPTLSKKHKHIFTHVEWDMISYLVRCDIPGGEFHWTDRRALTESIALPTAFRAFLKELISHVAAEESNF